MNGDTLSSSSKTIAHLILDALRSRPNAICQIDAATGETETNGSVLSRSIELAKCLRKFGAKVGDVLALGGRNHLDVHIPYYAGVMNGYQIAGVDPLFKYGEIKVHFKLSSPRIAFCQREMLEDYHRVVKELGLNTKVICFGDGEHSLEEFMSQYRDDSEEEFVPTTFDVNKDYIWLVSTGGTSGTVKLAAIKHDVAMGKLLEMMAMDKSKPTDANAIAINFSPVQWLTGFLFGLAQPLCRQTKLMTSSPLTATHMIEIINKYKPVTGFLAPPLVTSILRCENKCDFTCFDNFMIGGAKVHSELLTELRARLRPDAIIFTGYGQTENCGGILIPEPNGPVGNCGKLPMPGCQVKLVDPETGHEITEPNVPGEMWNKEAAFTEYYKDPEETAAAFSADGWFKTGDIMYRDELGYYYFVERLKMLIKYRSYHVIPPELEAVIARHPGVSDVSVTSIDHDEDGEHPVACVVRTPGATVTAQQIKELVASKLSDSQRLRGGVVFLDQIPLTSTGKVARGLIRKMVANMPRE